MISENTAEGCHRSSPGQTQVPIRIRHLRKFILEIRIIFSSLSTATCWISKGNFEVRKTTICHEVVNKILDTDFVGEIREERRRI